jgi:hypothetical protein
MNTLNAPSGVERWMEEQIFEEDVRAILTMIRPHRRERLEGWSEYRTGGAGFRVTVSWSEEFPEETETFVWRVPRVAEVLESLLVGSLSNLDDLAPEREFAIYRQVVEQLRRRVDELEACYT